MAATYPPKLSPMLMTPDPHYIPGYGGFCPQYKYNLGKTYGKLTGQLLTSPDVRHSGQLVLQSCPFPPPRNDTKLDLSNRRKPRLGDEKLSSSMIPGYTGFIPRSQKFFAKTYAETTRDALTDFQKDQNHQQIHLKEQLLVSYTGYVPRSRFLIGSGYPITTNKAITEFSEMTLNKGSKIGDLQRPGAGGRQQPEQSHIYLQQLGLLPRYTGYVPGYKFQYGHTYGHLTHNALGQSTLQKQIVN
ncbi:hypothetical protein GDO81_023799 [Engystomops pustulosus]|uniref:Ciliary microtubule inner protein 2B n=1 Tax=Engystomops pustulosus TaxID=76066 RepID=A0AAV6Z8N2_ENGPU|nr:hypothetical protein GDO81_023799 [Engystomops pustulosus]